MNRPEGVEVEAVVWDDCRRTFVLRLYHESFPIVPFGEEAPWLASGMTVWQIKVPKDVLDANIEALAERRDLPFARIQREANDPTQGGGSSGKTTSPRDHA